MKHAGDLAERWGIMLLDETIPLPALVLLLSARDGKGIPNRDIGALMRVIGTSAFCALPLR